MSCLGCDKRGSNLVSRQDQRSKSVAVMSGNVDFCTNDVVNVGAQRRSAAYNGVARYEGATNATPCSFGVKAETREVQAARNTTGPAKAPTARVLAMEA
jgi:hypothetical protein